MTAVQHIALNCMDIRKQEAFYRKHFGFRRSRTFNAGRADEFVMVRLGDTRLELFTAEAGKAGARGGEQAVGFKHLAFEVPDIDAAVKNLNADDIRTGDVIDCSSSVPGLRVCFFPDPEGNQIEIMQGYKDDPALWRQA